jgi:hypothetical protein
VLDGNYNRSRPVKWRDVDLVVWVDYSFARTLRQAVWRAISRASRGQELWPGTGNCESFRRAFFSRDSIILWTSKPGGIIASVIWLICRPAISAHSLRLRHPRQAEDFIRQLQRQVAAR